MEQQEPFDKKREFFLAGSHQLKSPVAIIQWCLQSCLENKSLPTAEVDLIKQALVQADAMSQLIADMLHMFRLEENERTLERVDVNVLLDKVFLQYEPVAHRRNVHLVRGEIEQLPQVMADEGYLKQAFINLVDNAIKYSPQGGEVLVEAATEGDEVLVQVRDHGIGMTDADKTQLFKEFFRSPEARKVAHEGTGLGLVLVKHVVESIGGSVVVDSRSAQGSTFTLHIPSVK